MEWSTFDFVIFAALLAVVALGFWLVFRFTKGMRKRVLFLAAIVALFAYVWAELAVGVFFGLGS